MILRRKPKNTKKIKRKRKQKTKKRQTNIIKYLQKGGFTSPFPDIFSKVPVWRDGATGLPWSTLVRMVNNNCRFVYATSLPSEDIYECIKTLAFYMYVKNIKQIVSLQGCRRQIAGVALAQGNGHCVGSLTNYPATRDAGYEEQVWNGLKQLTLTSSQDAQITYTNQFIMDGGQGTITRWRALYPYTRPQIETIFHCYAGFGRTGSFLLFCMLRNIIEPNRGVLNQRFFGANDSTGMYNGLYHLFNTELRLDNGNDPDVQQLIDRLNIHEIRNETLGIETPDHHANLLISRINNIIIQLAFAFPQNGNQGNNVFLYRRLRIPPQQWAFTQHPATFHPNNLPLLFRPVNVNITGANINDPAIRARYGLQ